MEVGQGQEQAFGYLTEEAEKQIPGTDDLWFEVEAIQRRYLMFARPLRYCGPMSRSGPNMMRGWRMRAAGGQI